MFTLQLLYLQVRASDTYSEEGCPSHSASMDVLEKRFILPEN